MRTIATVGLLLGVSAASAPPAERIVTGDGIAAVTIDGVAGRIRIDPGAAAMPLIDSAFAVRAGLKAGMFGLRYEVGPDHVTGETAVGRIDYGSGTRKQRIGWTPKPYARGVEGVVGPGGLPDPVVRFVLGPARAGERTVTFRMIDQGGMMGGWSERFAVIDVGREPMRLRFDPHHPQTLATAGAGVRIAAAQGGHMTGPVSRAEIAFGVERPVRMMALDRPLAIGALSLSRIGVRTGDWGNAAGIAEAGSADPDEIVVTAKGKKRDPFRDRLALGADVLARCSGIVFDKPARQIRLTCA